MKFYDDCKPLYLETDASIIRAYKCRLARDTNYLGNNTAKLVTLDNNYFMHRDLLILMRIQRQ